MATEASQAQAVVQQNAAKDIKTDSEEKKQTEVIEEKKPESKAEQKPEPKAEQKLIKKSGPVASTPIPDTVWCVVRTNDGKHFFYNPTKRQSVWKMPEELKNRPDVEKLLLPKPEVKTKIKEEKDLQEEPPSKKIRLEAEVKEGNGESKNEVSPQALLEEKTINAFEIQAAVNMPVVSLEDRKKQFKELLAEKHVSTLLTWEREMHKVVYDKRFILLTSEERRQAFGEYVKDRYRQEKEPSELFRQLLEESGLDVKSTFNSFVAAHSQDKRFKNLANWKFRVALFQDYMKKLVQQEKEMNTLDKNQVKTDFMKMLSETPGIDQHTLWRNLITKLYSDPRYKAAVINSRRQNWFNKYKKTENYAKRHFMKMLSEIPGIDTSTSWGDVKNKVTSDRRYRAVSDTRREEWFNTYLNTVKKATSDDIKNKEEQDKSLHSSSLKEKDRSGKSHGEAAIENNKNCSVEKVKNDFIKMLSETPGIAHYTLWRDVSTKLSPDPRYKAVGDDDCRKNWFCAYLRAENDVKGDFMKMLSEIPDINPSTSWHDVKNKVSSNDRYKAVSDTRQEEWFKTYLKTVKDVKGDFMKMLSEIPDINPSTSWGDVKNKVSSDPRYKAVSDTRQDEWFKIHLKAVKNVKDDFMQMLSEIPDINPSTSWSDVKNKASSDPRYKAVSHTCHEEWFKAYLKTVKDVTSDDIKNREEQDKCFSSSSLKDKDESGKRHVEAAFEDLEKFPIEKVTSDDIRKEEVQEQRSHSSSLKRKNTSCLNHRETADEDFKQFLVKKVKDTKMSFTTFKARFLINPRWTMGLSEKEQRKLYDSHIYEMQKKNREILWSVLDEMNLPLKAEWSEVKKQVEADPRFVNYTDSEEQLADDYALFMNEMILKTKKEFQQLLSEMEPMILETKIVLQQKIITMSDIVDIIRQDKIYTALDSLSEQREQMLLTYINELNANNQTPR